MVQVLQDHSPTEVLPLTVDTVNGQAGQNAHRHVEVRTINRIFFYTTVRHGF